MIYSECMYVRVWGIESTGKSGFGWWDISSEAILEMIGSAFYNILDHSSKLLNLKQVFLMDWENSILLSGSIQFIIVFNAIRSYGKTRMNFLVNSVLHCWKGTGQTQVRLVSVFTCYSSSRQETSLLPAMSFAASSASLFLTLKAACGPSGSGRVCGSRSDFRVCVWEWRRVWNPMILHGECTWNRQKGEIQRGSRKESWSSSYVPCHL